MIFREFSGVPGHFDVELRGIDEAIRDAQALVLCQRAGAIGRQANPALGHVGDLAHVALHDLEDFGEPLEHRILSDEPNAVFPLFPDALGVVLHLAGPVWPIWEYTGDLGDLASRHRGQSHGWSTPVSCRMANPWAPPQAAQMGRLR